MQRLQIPKQLAYRVPAFRKAYKLRISRLNMQKPNVFLAMAVGNAFNYQLPVRHKIADHLNKPVLRCDKVLMPHIVVNALQYPVFDHYWHFADYSVVVA